MENIKEENVHQKCGSAKLSNEWVKDRVIKLISTYISLNECKCIKHIF